MLAVFQAGIPRGYTGDHWTRIVPCFQTRCHRDILLVHLYTLVHLYAERQWAYSTPTHRGNSLETMHILASQKYRQYFYHNFRLKGKFKILMVSLERSDFDLKRYFELISDNQKYLEKYFRSSGWQTTMASLHGHLPRFADGMVVQGPSRY